MDVEEENIESDASHNSNELGDTQRLHITKYPSQFRALANKFAHEKNLKDRRKLLEMYGNHLISFKRSILLNRKRWQQRYLRRQSFLRSVFMQQLLELETTFLELIPILNLNGMPSKNDLRINHSSDVCTPITRFYKDLLKLESDDWLAKFHMQKSTFDWLCGQLKENGQFLGKNSLMGKEPPYERQVALGLYAFATGIKYLEIARIFKITLRTTICRIMKSVAESIIKTFGDQYLYMPTSEEELDEIGEAFYSASKMPPVAIGVLGVCEVPAKQQVNSNSIESENSTIILQVLVDNNMIFRKVKLDTNQPSLFLEETNEITNLSPKLIKNQPVSRFIVTPDTYYPLRKSLMHKYHDPVEPHEYDFNEAVDHLFIFRDRALQRLFARWRILKCNGDIDLRTMEKVVLACCVLHNVIERNEKTFNEQWSKGPHSDNTKYTMSSRFKPVLNELHGKPHSWKADGASETRKLLGQAIYSTEM
ncbi:uncharacterized protein [Eurosta solidaginis]|uniref:uncharacterized protein n=1 Tax=Eurosta solidaginis TaxID=178769 RepID=UPI00353103F4